MEKKTDNNKSIPVPAKSSSNHDLMVQNSPEFKKEFTDIVKKLTNREQSEKLSVDFEDDKKEDMDRFMKGFDQFIYRNMSFVAWDEFEGLDNIDRSASEAELVNKIRTIASKSLSVVRKQSIDAYRNLIEIGNDEDNWVFLLKSSMNNESMNEFIKKLELKKSMANLYVNIEEPNFICARNVNAIEPDEPVGDEEVDISVYESTTESASSIILTPSHSDFCFKIDESIEGEVEEEEEEEDWFDEDLAAVANDDKPDQSPETCMSRKVCLESKEALAKLDFQRNKEWRERDEPALLPREDLFDISPDKEMTGRECRKGQEKFEQVVTKLKKKKELEEEKEFPQEPESDIDGDLAEYIELEKKIDKIKRTVDVPTSMPPDDIPDVSPEKEMTYDECKEGEKKFKKAYQLSKKEDKRVIKRKTVEMKEKLPEDDICYRILKFEAKKDKERKIKDEPSPLPPIDQVDVSPEREMTGEECRIAQEKFDKALEIHLKKLRMQKETRILQKKQSKIRVDHFKEIIHEDICELDEWQKATPMEKAKRYVDMWLKAIIPKEDTHTCTDLFITILPYDKLEPTEALVTLRTDIYEQIMDLKVKLSHELRIPFYRFTIKKDGKKLLDPTPFSCLFPLSDTFTPVHLIMDVWHEFHPNRKDITSYNVVLSPIIQEPTLFNSSYDCKLIKMVTAKGQKPFLGGYVDNVNCKLYHNAATQTFSINCKMYMEPKYESDEKATQTYRKRHLCMQTNRDTSTQMTGVGFYRSIKKDINMTSSNSYNTAEWFWRQINQKVKVVQKYIRRWYARRIVERRMAKKLCLETKESETLEQIKKESESKSDNFDRLNPRTKEDFDKLYVDLEVWRLKEVREITNKMKGADLKAALSKLLEDETNLLLCIERMRNKLSKELELSIFKSFIDKVSKPIILRDKKGIPLILDIWYKIYSRGLYDLSKSLTNTTTFLRGDHERLNALSIVKNYLNAIQSDNLIKLKKELEELISREANLMLRGVKRKRLMGLRERVNNLFRELIKKKDFNLAVLKFEENRKKQPHFSNTYCLSCNKLKPLLEFPASTLTFPKARICKNCWSLNNRACKRYDLSALKDMLGRIRKEERRMNDGAKIAFLITLNDLTYLIDCIWQMKSIISKESKLDKLVFIRWNGERQWSPWNCLLVTPLEAHCHKKIEDINSAYSKEMLYNIQFRHTTGRQDFAKLLKLSIKFKIPENLKNGVEPLVSCPVGTFGMPFVEKKSITKDNVFCKDVNIL